MTISNFQFPINNRGVSLYLSLLILSILLAIGLGLSTILIGQLRIIRAIEDSTIAFFSADTGIERELKTKSEVGTSYSGYIDLNNNGIQDQEDSYYQVSVLDPASCNVSNLCLRSVGTFKQTKRAVEIKY